MGTTTTINGTGYASIETAFNNSNGVPSAGIYTALKDTGGMPPCEGPDEYEQIPVTFLGVSGVGTIWGDFRGRDIEIYLVIVGTTKADNETKRNSVIGGLTGNGSLPARFSVTVPGGTARQGCMLARGGARIVAWMNLGGMYVSLLKLNIRQMSTTN